jgi:hypothetical protein
VASIRPRTSARASASANPQVGFESSGWRRQPFCLIVIQRNPVRVLPCPMTKVNSGKTSQGVCPTPERRLAPKGHRLRSFGPSVRPVPTGKAPCLHSRPISPPDSLLRRRSLVHLNRHSTLPKGHSDFDRPPSTHASVVEKQSRLADRTPGSGR